MKTFLYFPAGCEFENIIREQKSEPQVYFDFGCFHGFECRAEEQQIRLSQKGLSLSYPDIKKVPML